MIVLNLPIPPSSNNLYPTIVDKRGRKRRVKSREYRDWLSDADQYYLAQRRRIACDHIAGPCSVSIRIPKVRGDISNRIKAIEDFLVSRWITDDDKNNRKITIERDESLESCCVVTITPISNPADCQTPAGSARAVSTPPKPRRGRDTAEAT